MPLSNKEAFMTAKKQSILQTRKGYSENFKKRKKHVKREMTFRDIEQSQLSFFYSKRVLFCEGQPRGGIS